MLQKQPLNKFLLEVEANISFQWIALVSVAMQIGLVIAGIAYLRGVFPNLEGEGYIGFDVYLLFFVTYLILCGGALTIHCVWLKRFMYLEKLFTLLQDPIPSGKKLLEQSASRFRFNKLKTNWEKYLNHMHRYILVFLSVMFFLYILDGSQKALTFCSANAWQMFLLGLCITLLNELPALIILYRYKTVCFYPTKPPSDRKLRF